jgi:hypothetical protein
MIILGGTDMKKIVFKLFLSTLIFSVILLGTGCALIKGLSNATNATVSKVSTVIVKSVDGKESISTPSTWKVDTALNDAALLQVSVRTQEKYAMVLAEGKDSFSSDYTLSDYTKAVKDITLKSVTNAVATDIKDITVNGNKGQYFELSGEVQKIKVTYMIEIVDAPDKFYQVFGWTLTPKFDANKGEIKKVMDSFKIAQ